MRGRPGLVLVLVGAAWLFVLAAGAVHAAVVLPVALLVSVASLLRGGRSLLDRLMLAAGLLLGLTCGGSLIFAIWPWGLNPVPIAGFAFTVLIVAAGFAGRRPTLPRPQVADLVSLGAGGALAALIAWPLAVPGHTPLRLMLAGEDSARHLSVVGALQQTGGYLFQHWGAAREHVYNGLITYPQGSHMVDAVLDAFLRSAGEPGTGANALDHYMGFLVLWYAFLTLSMVWAAQWLAGTRLTWGRRIALVGTVAGFCAATELFSLVVLGYSAEVAGLAEMVLLVAILARPVPRVGQQLVTMAALLVAVGFTYYLYLPAAVLAVVAWLVRHRVLVWRHRGMLFTCAVAAVLAALPPLLGLTLGQQVDAVLVTGPQPPYRLLAVLAVAVLAGLLGPAARRSPVWRSYGWSTLPAVIIALVFVAGQRADGISNGYYANKTLHLVIALLIVGLGSLTLYLPSPRPRPRPRAVIASVAAGLVVAVVALAGLGYLRGDRPATPAADTVWARSYRASAGNAAAADAIMDEYDRQAGKPPVPTILLDDDAQQSYLRTLYLGALERTSGTLAPGLYNGEAVDSPDRLAHTVAAINGPVRLVADSSQTAAIARTVKNLFPDRQIEVVQVTR
jgi:hypothetical protein